MFPLKAHHAAVDPLIMLPLRHGLIRPVSCGVAGHKHGSWAAVSCQDYAHLASTPLSLEA